MGRRHRAKQKVPSDPLDRFFDASRKRGAIIAAQAAILACLLICCLINFHGISDNYLVNDDFIWLNDAGHAMEIGNLLTHRVIGFFRPLVNLSFWAQERVFPGNIPFYNNFNLVVHFLNTLLVFQLIHLLFRKRTVALAVAILFAVSDGHIGAVLWISARTTLLASCFLLASLVALMSWPKHRLLALGVSIALYTLALAAKETAIVGLLLVALIFVLTRKQSGLPAVCLDAVISFAVVSILYFALRLIAMGGLGNSDWGLGFHAIRNLAGGALTLLYPQPLIHLLNPAAAHIPQIDHPILLEILALPLVGLLLWLGIRVKKAYPMCLALGWMLLTLIPASFFRYRFLHFQSIQQTRYYYLATIGVVLILAILLSIWWESRRPGRMVASVAIFLFVCISSISYNRIMEAKWETVGEIYRPYVASVLKGAAMFPELSTLVVEHSEMPVHFMAAAVQYEMPHLAIHEVAGGRDRAVEMRPCVYVWYTFQRGSVQVHYEAIR